MIKACVRARLCFASSNTLLEYSVPSREGALLQPERLKGSIYVVEMNFQRVMALFDEGRVQESQREGEGLFPAWRQVRRFGNHQFGGSSSDGILKPNGTVWTVPPSSLAVW